jgi:hypothetical protein
VPEAGSKRRRAKQKPIDDESRRKEHTWMKKTSRAMKEKPMEAK